jgi:hypothetical protein
MSTARQIEVCAERLQEPERAEFLRLIGAGNARAVEAAELRAAAWRIYHSVVPPGRMREREVPL